MITVVFVHGISIRSADYEVYYSRIQTALRRKLPNVVLARCLWGDELGAKLMAEGASIPRYKQTKTIEDQPDMPPEEQRWELLAQDPLLELHLLALKPPSAPDNFDPRGAKSPGQVLDERIRTFTPSTTLLEEFKRRDISPDSLEAAREQVVADPAYDQALAVSGDDLGEFRHAWARAVIATALSGPDTAVIDAPTLTGLATALAAGVGNQPKGILGDWLNQALATVGTRLLGSRRGRYSDLIVPYVGDVLVYQGNGQRIRAMIAERIDAAEKGSPVVLLGHSLGGIACVDLLAERPYPAVTLLITAGSQAPLLYEMDALQKLRFGAPLPSHFPRWLNIYDVRDFLSYVAKPVFNDARVSDVEVNNRQQFPRSHGAYWSNPKVWDTIVPRLVRGQDER